MNKASILRKIVGLLAVAILSIIYIQSQIDQQKHLSITESILLFKENDIILNQSVIQNQTDFHKNFDRISRAQIQLTNSLTHLKVNLHSYSENDKVLQTMLQELDVLERDKFLSISNYKKQAAVNKFTKQYLPSAFQQALFSVDNSSAFSDYDRYLFKSKIDDLNTNVNRYIAGYESNEEQLIDMSEQLHDIAFGMEVTAEEKFELLSRYITKVIDTSNVVLKNVNKIQNIETYRYIVFLQKRYAMLFERESNKTYIYKSLLFTVSIALLLYLGSTLIRLQTTSTNLRETLSHLAFRKRALDSHAIVSITDVTGKIIYVNDKFCDISQYSKKELIGNNHRIIQSNYHDELFFKEMWKTIANGDVWRGQICNQAKDGSYYWVETTLIPRLDGRGKPYEYIGMRTDITAHKKAEDEIKSLARFPMEDPGPVMRVDKSGEILFHNQAAEFLLNHWHTSIHNNIPDELMHKIRKIFLSGDSQEVEISIEQHHWILNIVPVQESGYINLYGHDITEKKRAEESLTYQANHDLLTGLVNRYAFENKLIDALSIAQKCNKKHILLYIDMDQFKIVNDTCGHVAGDELLTQLSNMMLSIIRGYDTLARLGGDEFGVLLIDCDSDIGHEVANDLLSMINHYRFVWQDQQFTVGASIGLVEINASSESVSSVLGHADVACYAAKDAGRNQITVYSNKDSDSAQRHSELQWASRIPRALAEDRFQLMVQTIAPIQSDKNLEPPHYEILLRMIGEDGELIPPGVFIPAAERYNLMTAIDQWVVAHTFDFLHHYMQYNSAGKTPTLSINLSGESMGNKELLAYIRAQFEIKRVPAANICFEITETAAIGNLNKAILFITTLKELGCEFALDDFGSGLSSFSYLKSLPVDYLKIDGVFVKDIVDDPIDASMVEAINRVGHIMGIKTIAEFVENKQIMDALVGIGVDYAQGYHIDKPTLLEEKFPVDTQVKLKYVG